MNNATQWMKLEGVAEWRSIHPSSLLAKRITPKGKQIIEDNPSSLIIPFFYTAPR
jgi:hypothetical protein